MQGRSKGGGHYNDNNDCRSRKGLYHCDCLQTNTKYTFEVKIYNSFYVYLTFGSRFLHTKYSYQTLKEMMNNMCCLEALCV